MAFTTPPAESVTQPTRGLLLGAATAAHQVEGDNFHNDWWAAEQAGVLPHRSGEACRHYHLYQADFDLARSLGHNAHRFSIEWSRIEPREGEWDETALSHYEAVVDALLARGLEPVVTLHHFTNPSWFAERGGWATKGSVALFARYASKVASRLAPRVRYWLTINEPTVYVKRAYSAGAWPPFRRSAPLAGTLALRNLMRAHVAAYEALHRVGPDVMVGLSHSAPLVMAHHPGSPLDRMAACMRDTVLNRVSFFLLGRRPQRVLDFLGINYYSRQVVRWRPWPPAAALFGAECQDLPNSEDREFSDLGWEVYAPGLRIILNRFARLGIPLMVTENGIATQNESLRERFVCDHLAALQQAIGDGVPVLGYLYWTLMDNYEWSEGFAPRFGLAETDYLSQARRPRSAAVAFKDFCARTLGAR